MALAGNGVSKWKAPGFAIQAAASSGYSMFCWMRTNPGSPSVPVAWGGAAGVHSWLYSYPANGPYGDGYGFDDRDNAGLGIGNVKYPLAHGSWTPVLASKASQAAPPGTIFYAGKDLGTVGSYGTNLGAQTLTDLYIGSAEDQINGILQTGEAIAEVAIWSGPLGASEAAQLLSGVSPLNVAANRLLCYFPLRDSLQNATGRGLALIGPSPTFVDHPPVDDYRNVLGGLQDDSYVYPIATIGRLTATTGLATIAAAGGPIAAGRLSATTGAAVLAGIASNGTTTGTLNATTGAATIAATAGVSVVGTLVATTGAAVLVGAAQVRNPLPTVPTSVITIGAVGEQTPGIGFQVEGTYSLYPSLSYSDDGSPVKTAIPIADATPYGFATFAFVHPGEPAGQHTLTITDTTATGSASVGYLVDQDGNIVVPFPPAAPALQSIIPAYLYEQYYDDQNLQSFISAYNSTAQTYLDWFNGINLPIYPTLSGALLDWIAQGLYGISRPTLALVKTSSVGPFNTYTLDSLAFNASLATGTATVFPATDDIFKRIITWSFYKGDGKVFSVKWLKRRIMRFLAGIDGTDYTGPTYQVSVRIVGGNAITIALSNGAVPLNLAPILQVALLSGVLPLPFRYLTSLITVTIPGPPTLPPQAPAPSLDFSMAANSSYLPMGAGF
jgi:hypothetical protein